MTELHDAVMQADIAAVAKHLKDINKDSLSEEDAWGRTPLDIAKGMYTDIYDRRDILAIIILLKRASCK